MKKEQLKNSPLLALFSNLLLAYIVYMICRLAYLWENWDMLSGGWNELDLFRLFCGALRFDTSAICYTNGAYCLLMLLPLAVRRKEWWQQMCRWIFVVINSLAVVVNLADSVYSQFTGRRTTATFFSEFRNDGNLGSIVGIELLHHWYFVLLGLALIAFLWFAYRRPHYSSPTPLHPQPSTLNPSPSTPHSPLFTLHSIILFLLTIPLLIIGIRGGTSTAVRPIAMSNAMQYVNEPNEAALVLNTPFTFIRTLGKSTFEVPDYFADTQSAEQQGGYSSLHPTCDPAPWLEGDSVNVVILILESFGQEYIGAYNDGVGYTPFLDSLLGQSLVFRQGFCNGRKSIDAMPSVLASIPMFVEPFVVTPYGLNEVRSVASELGAKGYHSAFFHGAENGSMGFEAFARAAGYERYYGRSEYDADPRFGGEQDFDGTWAIWDEEFLQFYALQMSQMEQPFVTTVFTASSHHPFRVPQRYEQPLSTPGHPMYRCVRYVDQALRKFFATCSQQAWYKHTLFVITADHTNVGDLAQYKTPMGVYRVPIALFDPSGRLPRGWQEGVAQQIDIMPTVLRLVGASRPYIAYGKDLLGGDGGQWAVNYNNGIYQYLADSTLLQYDGSRVTGLYRYPADALMQHNLLREKLNPKDSASLRRLQGILYDYMRRMSSNELVVRGN